jgi:outer membrane receptor for ferrienterochelin and colicin
MSHYQSFRTFRLASILLGFASIVESNGVLAQEQAVIPAGDMAAIENVEVSATKANERQLETAAKVFITREELQKFSDKTVSDALKRVPGVTVDQEVRIRGLGSGYTQILVDGNPVPAGFTLDSVSPSAVERIEVYRTALAEFSTRAIAGTINIILRKQVNADRKEVNISAESDQGRWSPATTFQMSRARDSFSYQIGATASRTESERTSLIEFLDFDGTGKTIGRRLATGPNRRSAKTVNLSPQLNWKSASNSISWQSFLQHYEIPSFVLMEESTVLGPPSSFPFNRSVNHFNDTDSAKTDLSIAHQFANSAKLDIKLGYSRQQRKTDFDFLGSDINRVFQFDRNVISNAVDDNVRTRGKYTTSIGGRHSLGLGWDGGYTRRSERRLQIDESANAEVLFSLDQRYVARIEQAALFAQDEWNVGKGLQIYLGLRSEILEVTVSGREFSTVRNRSSVVSPIAQLVWQLPNRENDQIRIGLARTYNPPAAATLVPRRFTVNNNNGPANSDTQGNPDLRPELALGVDVAYESYFVKGAFAGISGYFKHVSSVITPTLFQDNGEFVNSLINNGSADVYGIEFEFKAPLRNLIAQAPDLTVRADLAFNESSVRNIPGSDNRLATQTPISANFGFDYKIAPQFAAGLSYGYTSSLTARTTNELTTGNGPVRVLDAYGSWMLTAKSEARLSVANLLHQDRTAFDRFDGSNIRAISTTSSTVLRLSFDHTF